MPTVYKSIEGRGIGFIVNNEQRVSLHKAGRSKDVCPQPEYSRVFFQDHDYWLKQTVLNKQTGIIFSADAKIGEVSFNTRQSLLLENNIVRSKQDERRKTQIRRFAHDTEHLPGFSRLYVAK